MPASTDALVIMLRAPRLGSVKTRLAEGIGAEAALAAYRELAEGTAALARGSGYDLTASFTPFDAGPEISAWLGDSFRVEPQCSGDLGARMSFAIARRMAEGAGRVAVIGTDCPTITQATLDDAFRRLADADVVFGPARDGGYYLIALRAPPVPALFENIPWSARETLAASVTRARDAGLRVALLEEMRDVDTDADWRWHRRARASSALPPGHPVRDRS